MRRALFGLAIFAAVATAAAAAATEPAPTQTAAPAPIQVQVISDRRQATVGDAILVKVAVKHPAGVTVAEPAPLMEAGSTLVLEAAAGSPPPSRPDESLFFFRAQAFETGKAAIPGFRVDWRDAAGKSGSVTTQPIPVEIVSVLQGPQDSPADLKPPAELPPPPFPWKLAGGAALLLAALAAAAYAWHRRKRPAPPAAPVAAGPSLPPHEQAYRELERLLASGLLREGKVKEFHVELAEIAKRYLEGRFGIDTLERTSAEVVDDLKRARVGAGPLAAARELLSETDLVKFAKHHPAEDAIRRTVDQAYRLVDQTKMVIAPALPVAGETPPGLTPEGAG